MAVFSNYQDNLRVNTHRAVANEIRTAENQLNPLTPDTNTMMETSTNIYLYANGSIVGMMQNFSISEQRGVEKIRAIGYEGVVQSVPHNTKGGTLNVTRLALYNSSIWNALGLTTNGIPFNPVGSKTHIGSDNVPWDLYDHQNGIGQNSYKVSDNKVFKTLQDQRVPLEIMVKTRMNGSNDDFFIDRYIDCWLASYSKSYTTAQITVSETAQISYADVY